MKKKNTGKRAGRAVSAINNTSVNILGVRIDCVGLTSTLSRIERYVKSGKPHHIVTVNPEIILHAQGNRAMMQALKKSHLNTADGIGILWAADFLSKKYPWETRLGRYIRMALSGITIPFRRASLRSIIPERVTGVDLVDHIARISQKERWSLFFLGGRDEVALETAAVLQNKYPNIAIAGYYEGSPTDKTVFTILKKKKPDVIFVAYGSPKQEVFISENLQDFHAKVIIGVGGAFDFIAGITPRAPRLVQLAGLEWLYRLIRQPRRLRRIVNATFRFAFAITRSL